MPMGGQLGGACNHPGQGQYSIGEVLSLTYTLSIIRSTAQLQLYQGSKLQKRQNFATTKLNQLKTLGTTVHKNYNRVWNMSLLHACDL